MVQSNHRPGLNITIAVGAADPIDPENTAATVAKDLRLVKAALLYADRLTLYSPITSLVWALSNLESKLQSEELDLLEGVFRTLAGRNQEMLGHLDDLEEYRRIEATKIYRPLTDEELDYFYRYRTAAIGALVGFSMNMKRTGKTGGAPELVRAVEAGVLRVHRFSSPTNLDAVSEEFGAIVSGLIQGTHDYPLIDSPMARIFQQIIQQGQVTPSDSSVRRGRQVALATNLIERLPSFDGAQVDEILDIRRELESPLIRFRRGITTFADEIRTVVWDEDFAGDIQELFTRQVAPGVLDIEEAVQANRLRERVLDKTLQHKGTLAGVVGGIGAPASIGLIASNIAGIPELAATSSILAGFGSVVYGGLSLVQQMRERALQEREIAQNDLFFYYKTGELLKKRRVKKRERQRLRQSRQ